MNDESNSNHSMNETIDLAAVRAKLAKDGGKRFWQSLDELAETPGYRYKLENEFPENTEKEAEGIDRRGILKLMAASAAMAGLERVHEAADGENRSLRAAARGNYSGQAAVLRHVDDAIGRCDRAAG